MLNKWQQFGRKSESIAADRLKKQGYSILELNYRTKLGEIDIIAKDKDTIVFVEVKARKSNSFGNPKFAVTYKKQKKISMVALYYLKSTKQSNSKARFDVVSIIAGKGSLGLEIIKNAFELAYK
ncbi:MAG: YraN family protein [Deltaproteobacteria bacterium]|nr:YraN family protein [Deltaproteobacteria bacterium]MBW1940339.1 YraN family protein [Deltaproteobacteria bacterium]MBW2099312.1 YraN family protein [Deltaproteobacteria bacterium]